MQFEDMSRSQQERFLMPILLKTLQELGGQATRNEIKNELRNSDEISEEAIDKTRPSKNGIYHPFNFVFNFSITNLEMAGFLTCPKRGDVQLTTKGIMQDLTKLDIDKDIYAYSNPAWKKRSKKNKKTDYPLEEKIEVEESIDPSEAWKEELKQALLSMEPKKFEAFCRALIRKMGVEIDNSIGVSATRDGGIDGFGYTISDDFRTTRVAIQAKRWNENQVIGSPEIDKFRGAMDKFRAEYGIFISTTRFAKDAYTNAKNEGTRTITLIDGNKIIELVEKYQLYITPITTYQLGDFYKS
ncbi:MAG: Mrr restriction system protein [Haemophilus parahaemolyticus]|uniref:restriction endonuclease n=1 Tax=Haemophilus parahaemolyticus TaxID=735 RepID=UPI0026F21BCB|nr:Mrr restriction system protein [Haemophilus parahaemolyticus]MBS6008914.1 Mrr restriction system protein [Haemophilus parahaemolyticus]